ncbi:hypothetical protein COLO4_02581 [Corchorus olitorius]|uniref:Uncharacterized protein n=1 Tax=Corchorus olitorius TaxID=93759 RepID=A0A1R3L0U5_9ROSI|nr:hypothetical protein COLO4_02581 [Corchorus olitorius]
MSPTFITSSSGSAMASIHSPSWFCTCRPFPCAPISRVIRLMSPWAAARTAVSGSCVIGG